MSQGSATSQTTAVGELADDEQVAHIFSQRRKTGGKIEYLCKVASYVSVGIGAAEMRNEWLKPAEIKGNVLAAWEIVQQRRLEEESTRTSATSAAPNATSWRR